jgi:hypothetical protein
MALEFLNYYLNSKVFLSYFYLIYLLRVYLLFFAVKFGLGCLDFSNKWFSEKFR